MRWNENLYSFHIILRSCCWRVPCVVAASETGAAVEEGSSPKQILVFPPGEARTLVEGRLMFMSVLIKVDISLQVWLEEYIYRRRGRTRILWEFSERRVIESYVNLSSFPLLRALKIKRTSKYSSNQFSKFIRTRIPRFLFLTQRTKNEHNKKL